jgi:glycosyltransferase involved in cell wall biosynthesis
MAAPLCCQPVEDNHGRMQMKISVILCTYNRSRELRSALASLASSRVDNSVAWQILVIDNNSTDDTAAVVREFAKKYPSRFVHIFEAAQGKSHALNRGIREAEGDILAFTDDDVIVEPDWLENLIRPLHVSLYDGVGGRTLPMDGFAPPPWLSLKQRFALAPLAIFDCGTEAMDLHEPPFGNNMAFRREVFSKYGDFRADLGPRPGSEIRCEDTEFGQRLLVGGGRLRYEPSAVLYHTIAEKRVKKQYFLVWWRDKARSDVHAFGFRYSRWHVAGIPLYLFRRLLRWLGQLMLSVQPAQRFSCRIQLWTLMGTIRECYQQSHRGPTLPTAAAADRALGP